MRPSITCSAESKLQELASGRQVPSAEIISAKRLQRDIYWSALRATLFGTSEALTGGQLVEAVASFERRSLEADQLADSAGSDAKRVAAHAVETHRLTEERGKKAAATDHIIALEGGQQDLWRSWTAVWGPSGLAPLHPSEMTSWRSALDGLLDRREKLEGLRDLRVAMDTEIRNIEPALRTLAAEIGLLETEGIEVALVATQVERRLESIGEAWETARDLDSRMSDVNHRIETLVSAEAEAKRSLAVCGKTGKFEVLPFRYGALCWGFSRLARHNRLFLVSLRSSPMRQPISGCGSGCRR